MRVYVLPISGGGFTIQLGILIAIARGYRLGGQRAPRPDLVLGSSGGNVAAYVGAAADWEELRVLSSLTYMSGNSFITGSIDSVQSLLLLPLSRALYQTGFGFDSFFNAGFTPARLRSAPEIWTGVSKRSSMEHEVFTNKAFGTTLLTPTPIVADDGSRVWLNDTLSARYLDGDIAAVSAVTQASASIPLLLKPVEIGTDTFCDGGALYASPLSSMSRNLTDVLVARAAAGETIRLLYMTSRCVCDCNSRTPFDIIRELSMLLAASLSSDIRAFIQVFTTISGGVEVTPSMHKNMDPADLGALLTGLDASNKHYAVILFPLDQRGYIRLTSITTAKLRASTLRAIEAVSAFVWRTA